jgi:predicted nucleic acid-binding protein
MKAIFDGCVAVKWLIVEDDSEAARRLLDAGQPELAPSLVLAELGNAVWKQFRKGLWSEAQARAANAAIPRFFSRLVPIEELTPRAGEMVITLVHPIYDCIYLALAERERLPLITVDQRLIEASRKLGSVEVVHLRDI